MKIEKLYRVYSTTNNFNGNGNVRATWYYADKKWVDVNYAKIIKGYADMDLESRKAPESYVNELFTEDEVEFLRYFIEEKFGANLVVVEEPLPINVNIFDKYGQEIRLCNFGEWAPGSNIIDLNKMENYDLPFKIKGLVYQDIDSLSVNFLTEPKPDGNLPPDEIFVHSLVETIY